MFASLIDRLGDRNPQLLRELKGRLRWRNIAIAVGLSLLAQLLMLLAFMGQLPASFHPSHLTVETMPHLDYSFDYPDDGSSPQTLHINRVFGDTSQLATEQLPKSGDVITAINGQSVASLNGDWQALEDLMKSNIQYGNSGVKPPQGDAEAMENWLTKAFINPAATKDLNIELQIDRNGQQVKLQIPQQVVPNYHNDYCTEPPADEAYYQPNRCVLQPGAEQYQVDWRRWAQDFFRVIGIVMAVTLLSAGSFLLIQNIDREQRRGTLTFVQLSPRSAWTILGGQILGAPIVVYIAIALCLPLQLGIGLMAGFGPLDFLMYHSFLLLNTALFFSMALLYGFLSQGLGGFQAWLFSGAMFGIQLTLGVPLTLDDWGDPDVHHWLALFSPMSALHYILGVGPEGIGDDALSFVGIRLPGIVFALLFVINGLVWLFWTWHALRRKFINSHAPLINRSISYLLTACFEICLLGFAANSQDLEFTVSAVACANLIYFAGLIAALQPNFQAMADWARFRHNQPKRQRVNRLRAWLTSHQSPPIVALAANLAIAFVCMATWAGVMDGYTAVEHGLGYVACLSLILVYGAMTQLLFTSRLRRPSLWGTLTTILLVVVPVFSIAVLYEIASVGTTATLQLLMAPWLVAIDSASLSSRLFALLGQWSATVVCTGIAARRLKQLGASESQAMLAGVGNLRRTS